MGRKRSKLFEEEGILSVVFDRDLGLCIELGDEKIDDDGIYGYAPTQDFIKALRKEIEIHVRNTMGGLNGHPTLRRVHRRFRQGIERRPPVSNEFSSTSKNAWSSFPEDSYVAVEEVRKMLGLSENQLELLLTLLKKADDGHLHFHVGNICIDFFIHSFDEKEIFLEIEVEKGNMTHSVKYMLKTPPKDVGANHLDKE